jgi:hypothetical protein
VVGHRTDPWAFASGGSACNPVVLGAEPGHHEHLSLRGASITASAAAPPDSVLRRVAINGIAFFLLSGRILC